MPFQTFQLLDSEYQKIVEWELEQNQIAIAQQKERILPDDLAYETAKDCWDLGFPYAGAIGGGLTYKFFPTSLGTIVTVEHGFTKDTLDATDYSVW